MNTIIEPNSEENELIEVYLENDKTTEKFFSLSLNEKKRVIQLGLKFIEDGNKHIQLWNDKEWQQKLSNIENEYSEKISKLELTIKKNEERFIEERIESNKHQEQIITDAIKTEKQKYHIETQELQKTNSSLLKQLHELHNDLEEKYNARHKEQQYRYEDKINEVRKEMNIMREDYETKLARQQNSTLKGKDGEEFVYGRLNMMFPTSDIEDTHKIPHRGDFVLRENNITMMIETKNYSKNVQKTELDKFYRDIENPANSDINCAIFVSLYTGICNRTDFDFEIHNGMPILFIHRLCDNFDSIILAMKFFKLIINQNSIDFSSKEITDTLKHTASTIKRNFNRQKLILDKYHSEQTQLIATLQANVIDLYGIINVKY